MPSRTSWRKHWRNQSDIGFIIDNQNADTHADLQMCCGVLSAGQADSEFSQRSRFALHRDRAAMLLGDDVVADRQTQLRTLAGRLGGKERLEQLVLDLGRDAHAVVTHPNLDRVAISRVFTARTGRNDSSPSSRARLFVA